MSWYFPLLAAAAGAAAQPVNVPHSIFVCKGDSLPTVILDYHDDHKVVKFAQFQPDTEFYLLEPVFTVSQTMFGAKKGWLINASGKTTRASGIDNGFPATVSVGVYDNDEGRGVYSMTIKAGKIDFHEDGCLSPPAPPVHLWERLK